MKEHNHLTIFLFIGVLFSFICSSCVNINQGTDDSNLSDKPQMRIKLLEAYQGVRDGVIENIQLPADSAFITVKICVENLSEMQQSIYLQDLFLTTTDNIQIFPIALGYDQSEAFSWLLPIVKSTGGKRISHKFYFFHIQNNEIVRIPAYQSLGCETSTQFKSLAPLFIAKKSMLDEPYILHFLSTGLPFTAKRDSPFSGNAEWAVGLGSLVIVLVAIWIRKNNLRAQETVNSQPSEDALEES